VTDAAVLSTVVDGVLLVVEVGRTRRDVIYRSTDALGRVGAHLLGAALNRVSSRRGGSYYYKYYEYDYYYARDGREDESAGLPEGGSRRRRGVAGALQRWRRRVAG